MNKSSYCELYVLSIALNSFIPKRVLRTKKQGKKNQTNKTDSNNFRELSTCKICKFNNSILTYIVPMNNEQYPVN